MIELIQYGYLETPYLSEFPYLQPAAEQGLALQGQYQVGTEHTVALQFLSNPVKDKPIGTQFSGLIENSEKILALQGTYEVVDEGIAGFQASVFNTQDKALATQGQYAIEKENPVGLQFDAFITQDKALGFQTKKLFEDKEKSKGVQFRASKVLPHYECAGGGYLNEVPYLTQHQYLAPFYCVPWGIQFTVVKEEARAIQFRSALYNTTNLRILVDFPSRGTTGLNWTATSTQTSSTNSFSVNNLNTDIVEQYWRSATGVLSATISCDTELPQGVYLDTLAILNHNLSGSATVILEGSSDPSFGTIPVNITLEYEANNMYYIAPTLPLNPYRYWRLNISDPGSADNFIRVGTIVFGSAVIFTNESFVDRVRFGQKQFVDKVYTEGFTNVSNDRGKKKYLGLEFRNLVYGKSNFQSMREIFDYAGINLKCLYIPVPQQASRFAVFGKLADIPAEEHNYKGADADYVDFSIDVDESL
ncbi:hypothetical protein EBR21_13330 [bacterium]|nr:hypothetical protein [bacterium]